MITIEEFALLMFLTGIAAGCLIAKGRLFAWAIVGFVFSAVGLWWLIENAL